MNRRGSITILSLVLLAAAAFTLEMVGMRFIARQRQSAAHCQEVQLRTHAQSALLLVPGQRLELDTWTLSRSATQAIAQHGALTWTLTVDAAGNVQETHHGR